MRTASAGESPVFSGRWVTACVVLVALSLGVYSQVVSFDFVNVDDHLYVVNNANVHAGPSVEGISWAFSTYYEGGWRPLVWLSFMLDGALGGSQATAYHTTNLLLHIANTLLLFALLHTLTGALWRSAIVAALFAVHPQHVEAVAWVTSRKDVLSTLFWLLTTLAYVGYVRRPSVARYGAVALAFALGLMAKPILVALPFTLLLLDSWPLSRATRSAVPRLLLEKLPLLVLAALCGAVTVVAQQESHGLSSLEAAPLAVRLANAVVSLVDYMRDMVWPTGLMAIYPHPGSDLSGGRIAASLLLLLSIQMLVSRLARPAPYLSMGWLWYLVTLAPVVGLIQFGLHARADRFTYVPSIGLFLAVTWGMHALLERFARDQAGKIGATLAILVIAASSLRAHDQVGIWRNSETLHRHALDLDVNHSEAQHGLGMALGNAGDLQGALAHLQESVRLEARRPEPQADLATVLALLGRHPEAMPHFRESLRLQPGNTQVRHNFAMALAQSGDRSSAILELDEIITLEPANARAHNDLGSLRAMQGDMVAAIARFEEALRLDPDDAVARQNLAAALEASEAQRRPESSTP